MVGNKSDLDAQRDVTFDEAKQFAEENGTLQSGVLEFIDHELIPITTHHLLPVGAKLCEKFPTLPAASTSEVTTLWRYTSLLLLFFFYPQY